MRWSGERQAYGGYTCDKGFGRRGFFSWAHHTRVTRPSCVCVKPKMVLKKRCPFCSLAQGSSPSILYKDERVVAFRDKNPSAFRHYLVIPVKHIPTIKHLRRGEEHYALVENMVKTGKQLLERDASTVKEYRFGFHRPPFNSINHLHLHCLALPFSPWWRKFKYSSYGTWGGYVDAKQVLRQLNPK